MDVIIIITAYITVGSTLAGQVLTHDSPIQDNPRLWCAALGFLGVILRYV